MLKNDIDIQVPANEITTKNKVAVKLSKIYSTAYQHEHFTDWTKTI